LWRLLPLLAATATKRLAQRRVARKWFLEACSCETPDLWDANNPEDPTIVRTTHAVKMQKKAESRSIVSYFGVGTGNNEGAPTSKEEPKKKKGAPTSEEQPKKKKMIPHWFAPTTATHGAASAPRQLKKSTAGEE
jgi:hypothetical protein